MDYTTPVKLKALLKITDTAQDTLLQDIIDRAKSIIDQYVWYSFEESTQTEFGKWKWIERIYTKKKPITSIEYIKQENVLIDFLDFNWNLINLIYQTYKWSKIEIKYTAWYPTWWLPKEIEQACLDICCNLYRQTDNGEYIKTKKIDTLSIEYFSKSDLKSFDIDPFKILDKYKVLSLF